MNTAQENADEKRQSDLDFLSTYISTERGATGQSNADVLGRLIVDAHRQLAELQATIEERDAQITNLNTRVETLVNLE